MRDILERAVRGARPDPDRLRRSASAARHPPERRHGRGLERDPDKAFWNENEWAWFLQHLSSRLVYPGRIFLNLNRQPYPGTDRHHADDLMDMFERFGAAVDYWKHSVLFELDEPFAPRA